MKRKGTGKGLMMVSRLRLSMAEARITEKLSERTQ